MHTEHCFFVQYQLIGAKDEWVRHSAHDYDTFEAALKALPVHEGFEARVMKRTITDVPCTVGISQLDLQEARCSRAYFCDEFRSVVGDRYIAISVKTSDLHAWDGGDYPHKISFRECVVLHECDRYGKALQTDSTNA